MYSNGIHTSGDNTDDEKIINILTSDDDTSEANENTVDRENNIINFPGDNTNDTREDDGTTLQENIDNRDDGTISSDTS